VRRRGDPLQLLYEITDRIYHAFDYSPDSTDVDSPMDVVLEKAARRLSGLRPRHDGSVRSLGIPCRYVKRLSVLSKRISFDAGCHARLGRSVICRRLAGWVLIRRTIFWQVNDTSALRWERDTTMFRPPRGIFKGKAETKLEVNVQVYSD